MRTCWKCGDSELERMAQIDFCLENHDDECHRCHRECTEKRDREEDLDPIEPPDQGERPGEVKL